MSSFPPKSAAPKGLLHSQALYQYILDTSVYPRESPFLKEIREVTAYHPLAVMITAPDEGPLLEMLLKTMSAKKTIEIGVFTGYSLLLTALSIPDDGQIVAIDRDRAAFNIGLPIIKKAGVHHKVEFVESVALPALDELLENSENEGSFDFAFVDVDKENYWNYHERLMKLLRVGGIAVYDNTLWWGFVAMDEESVPYYTRSETASLIEFNKMLAADSRVHICHTPIGDGVTLCRRIR